jgi:ABC-type nickel/cobalt efflux system permease component RcnA
MTWLLFLAYLGFATYQKVGAAGGTVDQPTIMNALTVLAVTAVVPFFISYLFTRATQLTGRTPAILIGFISAVTLSVVGYWVLWRYMGGISDMRVPMQDALKLGLIPGLAMGLILAVDSLFRRSA